MLSRRQLANAIRVLSMDAIERAGSGHPGMPMGMADIAEVLWNDFLVHNPGNPGWINRDRFIMSNGHGAMLLYSVLHLSGYALPLEQLKNFRQLHSSTPGHPEYGDTPGVEATTGPLGQGLANAVGMAIAERKMAAHFNRDGLDIIGHNTYFFAGDGCLMEGVSHEACSLAGTQRLGKLIGIFDSNRISIDGDVHGWFTDDTVERFRAYGWHVVGDVDGHAPEQISVAINAAIAETGRPSLICCNTVIGWGAPEKQGTAASHGAPLGAEEVARTRTQLGWEDPPFIIPDTYYAAWDAKERGRKREQKWQTLFAEYSVAYPQLADELLRRIQKRLPQSWQETVSAYLKEAADKTASVATRKASQEALCAYGPILPELVGGSADLTCSNLTRWDDTPPLSAQHPDGHYIYYGVREFAMAAINNGIALYGGLIPYAGTFLMFSEYARNALRMAALMGLRNIFVLTHDSIGLGEDGPTHQAIEQAATLRLMPNMSVWRPCDTVESAIAWQTAIERTEGPTALLLSRQGLPHIQHDEAQCEQIKKGGYVLLDSAQQAALTIIATGSEVSLAYNVGWRLNQQGEQVRVVSMPSTDVFDMQKQSYRDAVLNPDCKKRIAIEAGVRDYWYKYVGLQGSVIGLDTFGRSAPATALYQHFGITEEKLMAAALALLQRDVEQNKPV